MSTETVLYAWEPTVARDAVTADGLTVSTASVLDASGPLVFTDPIAAWGMASLVAGVGQSWDLWAVIVDEPVTAKVADLPDGAVLLDQHMLRTPVRIASRTVGEAESAWRRPRLAPVA